MSTIKSSTEHLTLNADGTGKSIKFQANGVEKASISSAGAFTSTSIDATKLSGDLPAIDGSALTNLPAGGITEADQWRLTTSVTGNVTLTVNLERVDSTGFGKLGTGMTEASGVFTFPSTGVWKIDYTCVVKVDGDSNDNYSWIKATTNNSTYSNVATGETFIQRTNANQTIANASTSYLFDVTDTSTHKVKFASYKNNTSVSTIGSSTTNYTHFTFIKLGDT
jgi:hypothetical protein